MMFINPKSKTNRTHKLATRVVKTSRWIHRNELRVGMYVRELDCAWEDTHFMFQGFVIDSVKLLHDVQEAAEYVCIESEKLARIAAASPSRMCAAGRG